MYIWLLLYVCQSLVELGLSTLKGVFGSGMPCVTLSLSDSV